MYVMYVKECKTHMCYTAKRANIGRESHAKSVSPRNRSGYLPYICFEMDSDIRAFLRDLAALQCKI